MFLDKRANQLRQQELSSRRSLRVSNVTEIALVNAGHVTPTLRDCYFSEPGSECLRLNSKTNSFYLRNSSICPVNFAFQAFLKVRRSIKWINTFCRKNSVRFVRMLRLKDLDMSLKTLDRSLTHRFMA